ncbi:collectin-11 [Plakobranchus ocellatus]|uniref:Collectin-11 n=1 Tax=Plakobranchus ocellatus TaxID=259542 RepID=A0AAV4BBP3_9GAST|nr:collectin-11 [Plakobranchus ocellatus]
MFAVAIFITVWICVVPSFTAKVKTETCPSHILQGGAKFLKSYRGKCYKFYAHPDSKKQYWEAQKECEEIKGNLAMPKTKEVNQFLVESLLEYDMTEEVFIGLDDMDKEDNFKWKDGSELMKPKFYQNFASGTGIFRKRGGQSRDCVTLDPVSNTWQDIECRRNILQRLTGYKKKERSFVCEAGNDEDDTEADPDNNPSIDPDNDNKAENDDSSGDNVADDNKSKKKGDATSTSKNGSNKQKASSFDWHRYLDYDEAVKNLHRYFDYDSDEDFEDDDAVTIIDENTDFDDKSFPDDDKPDPKDDEVVINGWVHYKNSDSDSSILGRRMFTDRRVETILCISTLKPPATIPTNDPKLQNS